MSTTRNTTALLQAELRAASAPNNLSQVSRSYQVRVLDTDSKDFVDNALVAAVRLDHGSLYVNDELMPNPRFGRGFVSFCAADDSRSISGVLNFTPDGNAMTGTIFFGANGVASELEVGGVAPVTTYTTQLGDVGAVPPQGSSFPAWSPPAASKWSSSINFTQTYQFHQGKLPQSIYEINGQDVTIYSAVTTNPANGNLVIAVDIPASILDDYVEQFGDQAPASFTIEVSGTSFSGAANRVVATQGGGYVASQDQYAFQGQWTQPPASSFAPETAASEDSLSAVTSGTTLGITQLYTLQVDPHQLQNDQFNLLVENMKWALGQDPTKQPLLNFFGELPPDLPQDRTDLIVKDASYYTENMVTSYLGNAINKMTGPGAPTTRLNDQEQTNLDFYLRAGLPKDPAFGRQTHGIYLTAFSEAANGLSDYVADQAAHTVDGKIDPAHDWATQLFNAMTQPQRLNMTFNGLMNGFSMDNINRHTGLLMAIEPGGKLAKKYHKTLLVRSLAASIEHLDLSRKASVASWLEQAISGLITVVVQKKTPLPVDPDTAKRLEELAQELDDAVDEAGGITGLAGALADLLVAASSQRVGTDFWDVLRATQVAWKKAGYVFARGIYMIAIIGGLVSSIISFLRWDKLNPIEKASAITAVIEVAAKIAETMKQILSGEWSFTDTGQLRESISNIELTEPLLPNDEQVQDAAEDFADDANPDGNGIATEGTSWAELFSEGFDVVMSVIGAITAGTFAILSTITFIEDLIDNETISTTVLDGVIAAANIGVAIAAVVSIFSAAACVPILGAVCAVIGVIAALIEMLIPKPKPETPAEKFMENNLLPAMGGPYAWILGAPSGWTSNKPVPAKNAYATAPAM